MCVVQHNLKLFTCNTPRNAPATRNERTLQQNAPQECKKNVQVKYMEFNGDINFLAAFLDGLPTPERSERLEVGNDSSTFQAQKLMFSIKQLLFRPTAFSCTACVPH